jgi:hypothetical protein
VGGFQLSRLEKNQNRTLRFVNKSLKMHLKNGIFSCTANRKPELCTYKPITKEKVQFTDSKEIKTMFHSILCRFLSAFLKIY